MPPAQATLGVCLVAMALSACGAVQVKPGGSGLSASTHSRGRVDDPRTTKTNHVKCLRSHRLSVREIGRTDLQIGGPGQPYVHFAATPGIAQGEQINGTVQGAEVIGSALLYPRQATDAQLKVIENCLAEGVFG